MKNRSFDQGRIAYELAIRKNPHHVKTPEHWFWLAGFNSAVTAAEIEGQIEGQIEVLIKSA